MSVLVSTHEYSIEAYSEKAIAVFVSTTHINKYEPILVGLGSSANYALKGPNNQKRTGFVFPKGKLDAVNQALLSGTAPTTPVVGVKKSASSATDDKLAQDFAVLQKLVYTLSARLEAVEAEQQAARKAFGASGATGGGGDAKAHKRPASAAAVRSVYDMEEAYEDDDDVEDEPVITPFKSLIVRKPPSAK
jgi:hypothetical protein